MRKKSVIISTLIIVFSFTLLLLSISCSTSESEDVINLPVGISFIDLGNGITLEINTPVPIAITIITDTSGYPQGYITGLVSAEGTLEAGQTVDITFHSENEFADDCTIAFLNTNRNWEPVLCELSTDHRSLSATLDHLSVWAVTIFGKSIISFDFLSEDNPGKGLTGDVIGSVQDTTINLYVPYDTGFFVDDLVPSIVHTGESVDPADGAAQDFTDPVVYRVTAADDTWKDYIVTVTVAPSYAKDITSFDFLLGENSDKGFTGNVIGSVGATTINLQVPYGAGPYVGSLVPNIVHTGESVLPADGAAQDFTNPVTYTVTAEDLTTKEYTVTVTVLPNDAKDITSFDFLLGENSGKGLTGNVVGSVDDTMINLQVPYDTGPYVGSLVPNIVHTGQSVSPADGAAQDFTNPVTYTVTAEDLTTKEYTVTVTVAPNYAKDITSFDFLLGENSGKGLTENVVGSVDDTTINLQVPYDTGPYVGSLVPNIVHTGESVSPADGAAQDFTNPVTYTVTAEDLTTKEYTVTVTVAPPILLAHWTFDEGDGYTVNDSSGNNLHGTLYGRTGSPPPQWIPGIVGDYALMFDGDSDYVNVPYDDVFNAKNFTLSAWLYIAYGNTDFAYFRGFGGWHMRKWDYFWDFVIEGTPSETIVSGHQFPEQAGWHHYAVVVNSQTNVIQFFVDGQHIDNPDIGDLNYPDHTYTNSISDLSGDVYIGQYSISYLWNGEIDDVRFYNVALRGSEIYQLYQMGQ